MAKYVVEKVGSKLAMVKYCLIVHTANSQLWGVYTREEGGMERAGMLHWDVTLGDLHNAYIVAKYELWPSELWEELAMVKDCLIVQMVNLGRGTHRQGRYGKGVLYFCGRS